MLETKNLGRRVVPLSGAVSPRWGMGTLPTGKHDVGRTGGGRGWRGRRRASTGDVDLGARDGSSTRRPPGGLRFGRAAGHQGKRAP
jgi:hypothetical protein